MVNRQTYIREGSSSYMVIEADEVHMFREWEVQMLINNQMIGLIPFERRTLDQIQYYYYNITSMQPLQRVFEKRLISEKELRKIIQTIQHIFLLVRQYILDTKWIQMDPNEVYVNMQGFQPAFAFIPYDNEQGKGNIQLAEFLMEKVSYDDSQAIILSYGFYQIMRQGSYGISQITELLESRTEMTGKQDGNELILKRTVTDIQENELLCEREHTNRLSDNEVIVDEKKGWDRHKHVGYHLLTGIIPIVAVVIIMFSGICINEYTGEWNYINVAVVGGMALLLFGYVNISLMHDKGGDEEEAEIRNALEEREYWDIANVPEGQQQEEAPYEVTTVLDYFEASQYILKSVQEKERDVVIENWPFTIGTFHEGIDCRLNNHTVSKFHAKLNKIDGRVFIQDLNSTNGTFINGIKILDDKPHELCDYDYIDFGGEKFIYRMKLGD